MEITIKHQIELTPAVQAFLTGLLAGKPATEPQAPGFVVEVHEPAAPAAKFPHEPVADIQEVTYTVEQVREVVAAKTTANPENKAKAKALLSEFGATSVTTLNKAHYADFVTRVKAL